MKQKGEMKTSLTKWFQRQITEKKNITKTSVASELYEFYKLYSLLKRSTNSRCKHHSVAGLI